jgi:hypothetical protein
MWSTRIKNVTDQIPKFNYYLLKDFRSEKIDNIPDVLDELFKQSILVISNHIGKGKPTLKYLGYRELTPDERVTNLRNEKGYSRNYSIRTSLCRNIEFIFEFEGEQYKMPIDVPYVDNYAVTIKGVPFYPIFTIVERGGVYRDDNCVVLQVMRAKLRFWREKIETFTSIEGDNFRASNITAKLHQKSRKLKNKPPLILHHLANYGFIKAMDMLGVSNTIMLVETPIPDKNYQHIKVRDDVYIRLHIPTLSKEAKRVVVGLLSIYSFWKKFTFKQLFDPNYYVFATGKWNYPNVTNIHLLYDNAMNHLNMNKTIIDPAAKKQHESVCIIYDDLDGLMTYMFKNIDYLVVEYSQNSNNLFSKKIAAADQMLSNMIKSFNTKLLDEIVNSKIGLKHETIKKLMYPQSYVRWVNSSPMFRGQPTIQNDNYLLSIGRSKFRTTANTELSSDRTGNNLSFGLLKAHPSFMVVESISVYPSNPVIAGSINPFLQIDNEGYILTPPWIKEIENVYN